MTRAIWAALLGHWRRNPLQLITLLAGLALGTALWSGVQAINAEARASYAAAAATLGEGQFASLAPSQGGSIAQSTYIALRRAGWLVSPVIEGRLRHGAQTVRIVGIEPLSAPSGIIPMPNGVAPDPLPFMSGAGQVFGRAEALAALPDTVTAQRVAVPEIAPNTVLTDIGLAQRLLNRAGEVDRLLVASDQPLTRRSLAEVAPGLSEVAPQAEADMARLTDSFHLNLTAFGLLSFAVGLFIVHGAIGLAFEQRRAMVRTLRALGVPLTRLIGLMAAELALLAIVAGALGVALGYAVAAALLPDVAASLRGLYGAEVSGSLSLRPAWWLSGLAIALGGTALAGGGALISLARMPLLASVQPQARARARRDPWLAALAVALLLLAGSLALWGHGLRAGFVMLGALLLGGALALPPLLGQFLRLAQSRAQGPVAQWFWADSRAQLPGLSLALMALLLAMAANVGVSTMVSSFRLTFTAFLDQRLAAELYVTAATPEHARAIEALGPPVRAVLPLMSVETEISGQPATLHGLHDDATYRDNWQFLRAVPQVWRAFAQGEGVLINEQLYRRAGLGLGDAIPIAPGLRLPVLGIYGDYGNPVGQVSLSEPLFRAAFPDVAPRRFGLRVPPDQLPSVRRHLVEERGIAPDAMIDQSGLKALSLTVFERTFAVTAALNVLTLAVAGFAMLMSLLTLAAMRLPQLAPVWALGLTRRSLAGLDLLRALVLAALTGVLALPLGLALAWALLAVVNVEAFGWRLPMYLFPADYARLTLLSLGAAGLAALWPAWQLSRMAPARLLGVFRNER
ncbi:putative ABC transport system permease protein [Rhodobacter aestuarii]|uniref:Putative ABC transport system permease protein n=1 Tax=Rhodobacter aestuarii TaxID=453582 RepID=A0A1N7P2W5_9RHOB|nr:ABC transporter permease [Rhodobacter aestuarii]PTV97539.1 putative ABC transport system permease protein [Rhodobacter aestuarii]SIT04887.1 putative ABC transport system permease protein [Rhodobacter aestuarii]